MDQMTLSERITAIMVKFESQPREIALVAGVKPPSVYNWLDGRTKELSAEPARLLAEHYGLNMRWLTLGIGEMQRSDIEPIGQSFVYIKELDIKSICGTGRSVTDRLKTKVIPFDREEFLRLGADPDNCRYAFVPDYGMSPRIAITAKIIVDLGDTILEDGEVYLLVYKDGKEFVRRLVRDHNTATKSEEWIIRCDNQDKSLFPDKIMPPDGSYTIIGRCIWADNYLSLVGKKP